jgi:hypothetical protein
MPSGALGVAFATREEASAQEISDKAVPLFSLKDYVLRSELDAIWAFLDYISHVLKVLDVTVSPKNFHIIHHSTRS